MSVPPLPPRPSNETRWSTFYYWQEDEDISPEENRLNDRESPPPPLPPRSLATRSLGDYNLLNRVPPAPPPLVQYGFNLQRTSSFTLPESNNISDPFLPRRSSSTSFFPTQHSASNNLSSVLNYMQKKQDNNLIDLNCGITGIDRNLISHPSVLSSSPIASDDLLRLFDPLTVADDIIPSLPNSTNDVDGIPHCPRVHHSFSSWETFDSPNTSGLAHDDDDDDDDDIDSHSETEDAEEIKEIKVLRRETSEIRTFCQKLTKLRSEFPYDDYLTNAGIVISPTLDNYRQDSLSIKLIIDSVFSEKPISFTCDIKTSVDHIISHVICSLLDNASEINMENFVLKVFGLAEYFSADSILNDYEYVHSCQKFDRPVHLILVDVKDLKRPLLRTKDDDKKDVIVEPEELLQNQMFRVINYSSLNILLEILTKEINKTKSCLENNFNSIQPQGVVQAVKAICTLLSHIETPKVTKAIEKLIEICLLIKNFDINEMTSSSFDYVVVNLTHIDENVDVDKFKKMLEEALDNLQEAIKDLILVYSHSFKADFHLPAKKLARSKDITTYLDTLLVYLGSIINVPNNWLLLYDTFEVKFEICHGSNVLAMESLVIKPQVKKSFFTQLAIDKWIQFDSLSLCILPREARLFVSLFGLPAQPESPDPSTAIELGWCGLQMLNYQHELVQGGWALGLWPFDVSKESGPLLSNFDSHSPFIYIAFPEYGRKIKFPPVIQDEFSFTHKRSFEFLDSQDQTQLRELIENEPLSPLTPEEEELIWSKRHYLYSIPRALPKVLQAAHGWGWACLGDIYSLLREWSPLSGGDAIALLSPRFPDVEVRKAAINWMKSIGSDELCNYLPQLVQVLRYEAWDDSTLVWFLLEKSLMNVRIAHQLYWLLKQNLDFTLSKNRMTLILNALLKIVGHAIRERLEREHVLLNELSYLADTIKSLRDAQQRSVTLTSEIEKIDTLINANITSLPLGPSLEVCGLDASLCTYFNSNTLPLKLVFLSPENTRFETLYKVGDDLRQDALTLQMIRLMNKLWLKEGLDLKIVTFNCIPTEFKKGFIEMVQQAETLRKIHTEHGLAGSFKDRSIAEWLQKHNTSELEYQQAVENFTLSCAGYCVATYILGVCDRHNDNIMIKTSGHIFHIDFGKFLGDSQMFGTFKRDRVPFVLTPDMAYVINGGDRYTKKFQSFIDLCCQAFNILREHSFIFLNLFSLMVHSGIPGVSTNAVSYVQRALLPGLSEGEAMGQFSRMIQDSLKSRFTQFNFFLHNLSQLRFSGDHSDTSSLSFVPKIFTKETDGKIISLEVLGCQKRYDPEKYYVYIVKVKRENVHEPKIISRSYREFLEFNQKLCVLFPLAKLPVLPRGGGTLMGRTNVREVAERRKAEIENFLSILLGLAEEVAHCPLVYTFFHPLLRDQEGLEEAAAGDTLYIFRRSSTGLNKGQVKLSILHKKSSLFIMVMHAKNLYSYKNGTSAPDAYVKTYLLPDPTKATKRKTKVVWRTNHPTFMEMLVYSMDLAEAQARVLHVSVWNYDRLQENEFLGAIQIPLRELKLTAETVQWYPLGDL